MKVLQNNSAQFHFPLRVVCRSCNSELEASQSDVKEMPGDHIRSEPSYNYVECPVCNYKNAVKPVKPPTAEDYYKK